MRRYFQRIEQRAEELGNFRRKPLRALEIHGRRLIDCLEASGRFDRVHLEQLATDFGSEMDAVLEAGRDEEEKLILLGTYFGLQFLLMNIRSIDLLRSSAAGAENPLAVYREFLRKAAEDFEELIRAYLERLLELFLAGGERPEFIVCAVGTRLHQDDVDMGIIDDGSPARTRLNRAIGRMAREMMRWTSLPDFYLSEHIGEQGFTVSIDEYRERLDRRILDFVSASEILSARPIVGSRRLFRRFQRLIHDRYFHARRKPRREHEGYLRGLLGEIESLLLWPRAPERISPKDDLLRLVGGVLWAYRTVERVREADAWQAFGRLARSPARRRNLFISLERSFTFVETFRHLYQQFAAQEETIDLTDPQQQESLERVANAMGYEAVGVVGAGQQLIVHYLEHVKEGRKAVRDLVPPISDHIRKITVFADWLGPIAPAGPIQGSQSLASEFQRRVLYFQGVKYWDDLLDALENREGGLLDAMLRELEAMDGAARDQTLRYFARWGYHTFHAMLRLLSIVCDGAKARGRPDLFASLDRAFLETIEGTPDEIRRFSTVFLYYPDLVYRYLSQVDDETLEYLRRRLGGQVWDIEVAANQKRLLSFCEILETSSRFFRRAIERICRWRPPCLTGFDDLAGLERTARGVLAELLRRSDSQQQLVDLGAYYDLQFLRIGLGTLHRAPLARLDAEFTEVADQYLEILFDICKAEVESMLGRHILTHDLLGLFVAGGHARERAHQDDYDLIVLLHSDSEEMLEYSGRILQRLNREIIRRGIIPQYRLADRFGGYVTRFSELEDFLRTAGEDALIEMSQLVGARLVVGSRRLEGEFTRRIIEGCVYPQKEVYARAVLAEIRSRHEYEKRAGARFEHHIKECRGGLRDLELAMLLWKVSLEIDEPIGTRFWETLAAVRRERCDDFLSLKESYLFLNQLRDVYRLCVGPSNRLDPGQLGTPAEVLGYEGRLGRSGAERLADDFSFHCRRSAAILEPLLRADFDAP